MSKKLADHLGQTLAQAAQDDARIFVLDGDLADSDGAMHFADTHPQRFLMTGIAEQNMVSVAAGMAETGLRPWVFSFAAFLCYRAYDQIRIGLGQSQQSVVLVGSHAGGLAARNGKTHAATNDLALMLSLPGMRVWAPGDFSDVELAVQDQLQRSGPCYIRLPRRSFAAGEQLPAAPGLLRWLRPKRPLCVVSTGLASHWALEAVQLLEAEGLQVGLLHCPCLDPLPDLVAELGTAQTLVVLEDHTCMGGFASLLQQLPLPARITALGWPRDYAGKSGSDDELRSHYGLSATALATTIEALARPSRPGSH